MVNKMGSTQPDRSLSSGIPIPHWMNKVWDRYEVDAFSPPSPDDGFFIRYPGMGHVDTELKDAGVEVDKKLVSVTKPAKQDFSLHTRPCQEFIPNAPLERKPAIVSPEIVSADPGKPRIKSQGTDDGFKGEGAACGKSVVEVAHQMIAEGKVVPRSAEENSLTQGFDFGRRRGSKSLPASPLSTPSGSPDSSPRQTRRGIVPHNRYFTNTFVTKTEGESVKFSSSWLLSGLLGHQLAEAQPASAGTNPAAQEGAGTELRRNKSLSSLAVLRSISEATSDDESDGADLKPKVVKPPVMRPNPSQFREMNFLSPTSM